MGVGLSVLLLTVVLLMLFGWLVGGVGYDSAPNSSSLVIVGGGGAGRRGGVGRCICLFP